METRTLRIWSDKGNTPATIYQGLYVDDDKNNAEDMETITWPVRRIGFIFDTKKACIVCFAQDVTSFNDPRPTDLVIDPKNDVMVKVLAAWSTDPLKADPPRQQVPCQVWAFGKRNMTEEEKRIFTNIRRGPQTEASRQRYEKKQEDYIRVLFRRELAPFVDVVKDTFNKAIAPIVQDAAAFKKARLLSTPLHELQWWQNLRAAYIRQSEPTAGMKWRAVAHRVVMGANLQIQKPKRDWQSDYLTPRMLVTLINKLRAPGASIAKIEVAYGDMLRRYVTREEQKAKKPAKSRA